MGVLAHVRECESRGPAAPVPAVLLPPLPRQRWELRAPFVAWFMQQLASGGGGHGHQASTGSLLLDGLRRYEVAEVQRHAAGQGLPRAFLQADLDFVLPGERAPEELLLGDAEVRWVWAHCGTEAQEVADA